MNANKCQGLSNVYGCSGNAVTRRVLADLNARAIVRFSPMQGPKACELMMAGRIWSSTHTHNTCKA